MKRTNKEKIQRLFVEYLLKEGGLVLTLPNGMVLEVGVTQENRRGDLEIIPDYCWVVASQRDRSVSIDSYNLGLRYPGDKEMVCEHSIQSADGININVVDVV
ncbi:hypothetical protein EBT16_02220 [bacterium]|nr:hypothetical protein [bacterium]